VRDVPWRDKRSKVLNSPNSDGIVPVIPALARRSKTFTFNKARYSVGIVPVNKLKERLTISAGTRAARDEMDAKEQATDAAKGTMTYQNVKYQTPVGQALPIDCSRLIEMLKQKV
jgi:hypothetical protein